MNTRKSAPGKGLHEAGVQRDVDRLCELWAECRKSSRCKGNFLFGHFTIVDAMFAPVALRFRTYCPQLPPEAQAYCDTLVGMPEVLEWCAAASAETWRIAKYEATEQPGGSKEESIAYLEVEKDGEAVLSPDLDFIFDRAVEIVEMSERAKSDDSLEDESIVSCAAKTSRTPPSQIRKRTSDRNSSRIVRAPRAGPSIGKLVDVRGVDQIIANGLAPPTEEVNADGRSVPDASDSAIAIVKGSCGGKLAREELLEVFGVAGDSGGAEGTGSDPPSDESGLHEHSDTVGEIVTGFLARQSSIEELVEVIDTNMEGREMFFPSGSCKVEEMACTRSTVDTIKEDSSEQTDRHGAQGRFSEISGRSSYTAAELRRESNRPTRLRRVPSPIPRPPPDEAVLQRIRMIFDLCDASGTGKVTIPGLAAVLTKHPQHAHFMGIFKDGATVNKNTRRLTKQLNPHLAAEKLFSRMDKDKSGSTDWQEFLEFVLENGSFIDVPEYEECEDSDQELPIDLSDDDLLRMREIFDLCDSHGKGSISLPGLMAVCTKQSHFTEFLFGAKKVKWDLIFKDMDQDGDNTISWDEFKNYFGSRTDLQRFYSENQLQRMDSSRSVTSTSRLSTA